MPTPKPNALKWIVACIVVCAFLAFDFVTPLAWKRHDEWLMAVVVGICIGQVNLIATWAALAPGNIALRLPWSMLLGVFMWYALVLGNRAESHGFTLGNAVFLGIVVLAGILAAQVPLWIARKVFRWRLVNSAAQASEAMEGPVQFYIWHLLAGMFFLSVALAPARIVLPPGDLEGIPLDREMFLGLPVVMICNLVVTVPCIWGAFLKTQALIPLAFAWVSYCVLLTAIEIGVFAALFGRVGNGSDIVEVMTKYGLVNLSQCAAVFGTLLLFRAVGFQLIRTPKP